MFPSLPQESRRAAEYERVNRTAYGTGLTYGGPESSNSYFRDLLLVHESDSRKRASYDDPRLRGRDPGDASRIPGRRSHWT